MNHGLPYWDWAIEQDLQALDEKCRAQGVLGVVRDQAPSAPPDWIRQRAEEVERIAAAKDAAA